VELNKQQTRAVVKQVIFETRQFACSLEIRARAAKKVGNVESAKSWEEKLVEQMALIDAYEEELKTL